MFKSFVAFVLFVALALGQTRAQTDRILSDFTLNGVVQPRTLVVIDDGGAFVSQAVLRAAGVPADAPCIRILEQCFVSLDVLKRVLTYHFDDRALRLDITTNPALLPKRAISVSSAPDRYDDRFSQGVVVNYGIHTSPALPWSGSFEGRITLRPNEVVETTMGRTISGTWTRGLSSLTLDAPDSMRRIVIGDAGFRGGPLDGSGYLGGVSISRAFSLNPYAQYFPTPSLHATVLRPADVDLYVNGAVVKHLQLAPGNYNFSDIPIVAGYSDARVIVRDQFGEQSSNVIEYGATSLLRPGLTDYHYAAGLLRSANGFDAVRYGVPVASAAYRVGTSEKTTLGASLQATPTDMTAAFEADHLLGLGIVQTDVAVSRTAGSSGTALSFVYGTTGLRSGTAVEARWQSPTFKNVGDSDGFDRVLGDASFSRTQRIDAATTLSFVARYSRYLQSGIVRSETASLFRHLGNWDLSASYTAGTQVGAQARRLNAASLTLTRTLGAGGTQSVRYDGGRTAAVTMTHANDSQLGTSYSVDLDPAQNTPLAANVRVGLPYGSIDTRIAVPHGLKPEMSSDFGGSVVYGAGRLFFGQPVGDAYAIVSADGMPGARVSLYGHDVATTDRRGYALLPFLASNQANDVGISSAGLPLEDIVDANGERRVAPRYHAGTFVQFAAHRVHAVVGDLTIKDARGSVRTPAFGEIDVTGDAGRATSAIDEAGRFYFDNLQDGVYRATIVDDSGTCSMRFTVPKFKESIFNIGRLQCAG